MRSRGTLPSPIGGDGTHPRAEIEVMDGARAATLARGHMLAGPHTAPSSHLGTGRTDALLASPRSPVVAIPGCPVPNFTTNIDATPPATVATPGAAHQVPGPFPVHPCTRTSHHHRDWPPGGARRGPRFYKAAKRSPGGHSFSPSPQPRGGAPPTSRTVRRSWRSVVRFHGGTSRPARTWFYGSDSDRHGRQPRRRPRRGRDAGHDEPPVPDRVLRGPVHRGRFGQARRQSRRSAEGGQEDPVPEGGAAHPGGRVGGRVESPHRRRHQLLVHVDVAGSGARRTRPGTDPEQGPRRQVPTGPACGPGSNPGPAVRPRRNMP